MKRILLTTTSLVLAAGVAHADVSFSGKGEVSVAQADRRGLNVSPFRLRPERGCVWRV